MQLCVRGCCDVALSIAAGVHPAPLGLRKAPTLVHVDFLQLSAMDVSAQSTMKGAAKCDKHCEMQNSVNHQKFERIMHCRVIPCSVPSSVSSNRFNSFSLARKLLQVVLFDNKLRASFLCCQTGLLPATAAINFGIPVEGVSLIDVGMLGSARPRCLAKSDMKLGR